VPLWFREPQTGNNKSRETGESHTTPDVLNLFCSFLTQDPRDLCTKVRSERPEFLTDVQLR